MAITNAKLLGALIKVLPAETGEGLIRSVGLIVFASHS